MKRLLLALVVVLVAAFPALAQMNQSVAFGKFTKQAQTITWASDPDAMTVGDPDQTLQGDHATASSGLGVTFSTSTTDYCTIVSNKLHAVAAGTCVVHADQAGNGYWAAASQVDSGNVTISSGSSCTSIAFTCTPAYQGPTGIAQSSAVYYKGDTIALTENDIICKVRFNLTKSAGDISGKTFKAFIYTLVGTTMTALLATSDGVTGNNSWSSTGVDFTFSTPWTVTSTTNYAVVVAYSPITASDNDASNYASMDYGANCTGGHLNAWGTGGLVGDTWLDLSALMTVYKQ